MKVYLWQAGTAEGVTDDDERARTLAASFMGENGAAEAVVETADLDIGIKALAAGYAKTQGKRWVAQLHGSQVVWNCRHVSAAKPAAPELAAS